MARKSGSRPGRTLVVFFIAVAILFGLVAIGNTWKPALGLDLKGGTRITLIAEGNPSEENLQEAADIIDDRVNGSGVVEAEVTTQGNRFIVVEIPGETSQSLRDTVTRQAQLRFRTVACSSLNPGPCGTGTAPQGQVDNPLENLEPTEEPTTASTADPNGGQGSKQDKGTQQDKGSKDGSAKNRPAFLADEKPKDKDKDKSQDQGRNAQGESTESPSATQSPDASQAPSGDPSAPPTEAPKPDGPAAQALAFQTSPDQKSIDAFNKFTCPATKPVNDKADEPLVTCGTGDDASVKYLLSPAAVEGTDLTGAEAGLPSSGGVSWLVQLSIGGEGKQVFGELSQQMVGSDKQFAIVLDGVVISAPTFDGVITSGDAQITGNFTEDSAKSLATSLKYGSLPIAFDSDGTSVEEIGATLAGDQLTAGITAGLLGLLLVMLYCLIYYRGLGLVVIASLVVAGAVTYGLVLLLGNTAGFTLTLPGIAGLIVAVGITADSFIVYFERIRDEMRDGKSMRVAVEAGWKRARNTCLAADTVSLLAAVVLYIFAAGVVKGFAFALGLSTLIDLVIFFWFTHPMVAYLGRYKFFNRGHRLSGLSAETLGVDRVVTAGGKA